jgi:hypothetical protein
MLFILPQLVLGGALIPLPRLISSPTATHWAFEALMGITGIGSDVAADLCWALPENVRTAMTLDQKQAAGCRCMGLNVLNAESCTYPGLGNFYNPDVYNPPPVAPAAIGDPPPEPALPARPVEPANQSDNIAMSEFFNELKAWEAQVTQIQADYKRTISAYQAQAEVYKVEAVAYQEALAKWQIARASAIEPAESFIKEVSEDYGWTYVNKENKPVYLRKIFIDWVAELALISLLFVGILLMMKRKDNK